MYIPYKHVPSLSYTCCNSCRPQHYCAVGQFELTFSPSILTLLVKVTSLVLAWVQITPECILFQKKQCKTPAQACSARDGKANQWTAGNAAMNSYGLVCVCMETQTHTHARTHTNRHSIVKQCKHIAAFISLLHFLTQPPHAQTALSHIPLEQ